MLQGVGEDGENMRNLLFSVFSRFSLLLPFLSPTPEEINPHSFRFSMQTWEEIPTVSVLLAGTGGIPGLSPWGPSHPTPCGCVWGMPQQSLAEGPRGHIWFLFSPAPSLPHCSWWSASFIITTKAVEMLVLFPTGWRLLVLQRLWSDPVPGTEPVLCSPSTAKAGSRLSPTVTSAVPCGPHLLAEAHTPAAVTTCYRHRN